MNHLSRLAAPAKRQISAFLAPRMGSMATSTQSQAHSTRRYHMPAEHAQHSHTLMAYPSIDSADNESELKAMQTEIITIANAISKFEPVHLYTRPSLVKQAYALVSQNVLVKEGPADQLWIRDSGPVYVNDENNTTTAVSFNFNYWGNKLPRTGDEKLALSVAQSSSQPSITSRISIEGGGIEHDGEGTFLGTESCIINENRNPGMTKQEIEAELTAMLGVTHFIWLPGIVGGDITDDHIDAVARFVRPGVVLLHKPHESEPEDVHESYEKSRRILKKAKDARGRSLTIHECEGADETLLGPSDAANEVVARYANYLLVNGGVIVPQFGQEKIDRKAFELIKSLFPEREVVQVAINMLPRTGGGIHCATQQVPA